MDPSKSMRYTVAAMSVMDVIAAYKNYDCSDEAKEPVLYFISELTGVSVDMIQELMDQAD